MPNKSPNMRLKKQRAPKQAPKRPLIYMLAKGTPNEMGEPKGYPEEKHAKGWANKFFEEWRPWCVRYNGVGEEAIDAAILEVDGIPVFLVHERRRVVCVLDEHTGMTLVAEFWKIEPPAEENQQ